MIPITDRLVLDRQLHATPAEGIKPPPAPPSRPAPADERPSQPGKADRAAARTTAIATAAYYQAQ
jgi:hypothetical protein